MLVAGKFIYIFTRLESEVFKDLERGVFRKHRNIQSARIFYDFAGIISFVHVHCDPVRIITHLCYRVDYETIVLFSVITRNDIKTISDLEKCGRIQAVLGIRKGLSIRENKRSEQAITICMVKTRFFFILL